MAEQTIADADADLEGKRRWLGYTGRVVGILVLSLIGSVFIAQRLSDGPLNEMIPGGPLRAGSLAAANELLVEALGDRGSCPDGVCPALDPVELELVRVRHGTPASWCATVRSTYRATSASCGADSRAGNAPCCI